MAPPRLRAGRPRVVMLVDNDVRRDSRVQKQAASMAERGWDVVLLGRGRPTGRVQRWRIGEARVRLLPVPTALRFRYADLRRARLRDPLAYASVAEADRRRQLVRATQAEVRQRLIERRFPYGGGAARTSWPLLPARAWARTRARWTDLRADHTSRLRERRASNDGWSDRLAARWWSLVLRNGSWRRLDPHLWDFHLTYGPAIDDLDPDLIHANDFRMLGVGARAASRARERGRHVPLVWDAHEFLPGIKPWTPGAKWHRAQRAHERAHAPYADAVVTVSEELADLLIAEHHLTERPTIVLNAPVLPLPREGEQVPSLRAACGVDDDVPLMVYSGAAAPQRGLGLMVDVLASVPELHCCFVVSSPDADYVRSLVARAEVLGVADRVHLAPYVPFDQVVAYLAGADVGVIPLEHWPNHEIALITKFFEYSHARLPIVVSDVRAMGEMTRRTGQGEVFTAGSVESLAEALRRVLADPQRYRSAYDAPGLLDGWTWESQADVLDSVYRGLLAGAVPPAAAKPSRGASRA